MDTGESNTELLETVRVERLSVSSEKPALDVSENAVKELLDNSCNFESVHEDWNSSPACPVLDNSQNAESDPLAEEPLTLDYTNCIPDSGDISFSAVENTDEMSWSTAVGNESTAVERMDSTHEQDTSSFLNITEKTNANDAEMLDIGVAIGDQGGYEILTETAIDDGADVIRQQCLSNSTEVPAAVCDVQASATISSDNERLSQADSSLAECTANGTTEVQSVSFEELCSSVKEPEEFDHEAKCHLLHDSKTADQAESEISKDWWCILGHDRLKKRVIKRGEQYDRPQSGQLVTVRCCGRLEDGTEIDRHDALTLVLGDADFIHAFDLCIASMDRGEKCELVTDAQYAYGELGREPDVPPNAKITYEIELLSFEHQPSLSAMPVSERLRLSNEKRERGNYLYARDDCLRAIEVYEKAIKIADAGNASASCESASDLQLLLESRMKCFNNLAAAQLKIEAWNEAIASCNNVLKVQPNNVKALFRKARCLISTGDYDTAVALLRRAVKLEPDNKTVQSELVRVEKRSKELECRQRQLYRKMLGTTDGDQISADKHARTKLWQWCTVIGIAAVVVSATVAAYRHFSHA